MKKCNSSNNSSKALKHSKSVPGSALNQKATKGYRPSGTETSTGYTPPDTGTSVKNIKK